MALTYDFSFLPPIASEASAHLNKAYQTVQQQKRAGQLGFTGLPQIDTSEIQALADTVRHAMQSVIIIGIGGSDLGARAVHRALNHQFYNMLPADQRTGPQLFFLGDTTDPVAIQEVLEVVDLAKTALVIISKSGNTIEQMSTFIYVRQQLIKAVGEASTREHIIVLTDAESGTLREIVREDGYRSLSIPADVGGRFSVLSTVGLFPLALVGVDIEQLLAGARNVDAYDTTHPTDNPMSLFALHQYLANTERHQPISVLMTYVYGLREVGFWYRQLWAESLGKRLNLQGETVETGPTPIAAVGPMDQHSQMQLYREGPRDKIITFITATELANDVTLPGAYPRLEGVSYLRDRTFSEILHAEQQSTALALHQDGRPSSTLTLERVDAYHLGMLLYFFELAVTYSGELYQVDTFNQPGVELGKELMYGLLGRAGFESVSLPPSLSEDILTL